MSKKILLQSVINKIIAVFIYAWFCTGAFAAQYLNIASNAGDAGVIPGNVILGDAGVRKIGEGAIVFPDGQPYTGPTNILEGTLINDGTMLSSSVNVATRGTFRSTGVVTRLVNDGSVETGGAVGNFLTAAEYIQHSLSALSIGKASNPCSRSSQERRIQRCAGIALGLSRISREKFPVTE